MKYKVPPVGIKELAVDVPVTGKVEVGIEHIAKALANANSTLQARFFAAFAKAVEDWPDYEPIQWERQCDMIVSDLADEDKGSVRDTAYTLYSMIQDA